MCKILIVDDNENVALSLKDNFQHFGYICDYTANGTDAINRILAGGIKLVLLDLKLAGEDGIEVLQKIKNIDNALPVILITGFGTIDTAVQAIKYGAFDYIEKPVNFDKLRVVALNAIELFELKTENMKLSMKKDSVEVVSNSPRFLRVIENAMILARSQLPILILGESGVGKDVIAEMIHKHSTRKDKPMERINSASFAESLLDNELFGHDKDAYTGANSVFKGVFERANGTTLFMDEIGDMPLAIQAKILRAIQNQEIRRIGGSEIVKIDTRFIAATNKNIKTLLEEVKFREDLYYRLNSGMLIIPPLRERTEDIPLLCRHFIVEHCKNNNTEPKTITDEVFDFFYSCKWPGNIRELKSCILYAYTMTQSDSIMMSDLPAYLLQTTGNEYTSSIKTVSENEKILIEDVLKKARYNKTKAAQLLKISRRTLYNKMESYGIE